MAVRVILFSTTTGYQLQSFGDAARRLGIELVLATDRCHHLDDPWRDGAIPVRFYDDQGSLQAIQAALRGRPVSGIVAVGDRPVVLAARTAQLLGLPGNPVPAAEATRTKLAMRQAFGLARLHTPWFVVLPAARNERDVAARTPYPCVLKPLGLSGSQGVIRADTPAEFQQAVARIRALLARPELRAERTGLTDHLLIEEYIEGREYAIEGLLTSGRFQMLALLDKPDPLEGPFFEETIYVVPSAAPEHLQQAIATEVQRATTALGLTHGPVHAECRVGPAGITMLEVASRPIGGLCAGVLRFQAQGGQISLEELVLRHATGEEVTGYQREPLAAGVMMIPIPRRGIYKGVEGEASARAVEHVGEIRITAKADQLLEPLPEGNSYLGFIFARAGGAADVVAALREAHGRLTFEIDPELRVIR
jgi:biotin carboxylase